MERSVDPAGLHGATHAPAKRRGEGGTVHDDGWDGRGNVGLSSCDYFVNNAYQTWAHATMLYTKMPDTLLGTELVSIRPHIEWEREREEKRRRGRMRICIHLCIRVGIYVHIRAIHYADCAYIYICIDGVCVVRQRGARPTQKSMDVSAGRICWCSWGISLFLYPPRDIWENYLHFIRDELYSRRSVSRWYTR